MIRFAGILFFIVVHINTIYSQSGTCYTCTGEGLDACATLKNQHMEQCKPGAFGCGIAAGTLPNKKRAVTVERTCLYEDTKGYCNRIKNMVHSQSELDYYCKTCRFNKCNSDNITSIVNRLDPRPVTVDDYPAAPTNNPCKK